MFHMFHMGQLGIRRRKTAEVEERVKRYFQGPSEACANRQLAAFAGMLAMDLPESRLMKPLHCEIENVRVRC